MPEKTHILKTWPDYFSDVSYEIKKVEIRKNDRDFKVGDTLILLEYDPETEIYSGRGCKVLVSHIVSEEPFVTIGYVAMSLNFDHAFTHFVIYKTGGTKDPSELTTDYLTKS